MNYKAYDDDQTQITSKSKFQNEETLKISQLHKKREFHDEKGFNLIDEFPLSLPHSLIFFIDALKWMNLVQHKTNDYEDMAKELYSSIMSNS